MKKISLLLIFTPIFTIEAISFGIASGGIRGIGLFFSFQGGFRYEVGK